MGRRVGCGGREARKVARKRGRQAHRSLATWAPVFRHGGWLRCRDDQERTTVPDELKVHGSGIATATTGTRTERERDNHRLPAFWVERG